MGTVFVKHFDLVTDFSDPNASNRRLETRLLVRDPNGSVYGVTYKWRPDNSDADLLTNFLNRSLLPMRITQPGFQRIYPSPTDCLTCHTPAANYVLGVKPASLMTTLVTRLSVADNQLRTLNHIGLLNPAFNESSISRILAFVIPDQPKRLSGGTRAVIPGCQLRAMSPPRRHRRHLRCAIRHTLDESKHH